MHLLREERRLNETPDKAARRLQAAAPRCRFTTQDVDECGAYQTKRPILQYAQSKIPGAGNDLFALVPLLGTRYDGTLCETEPSDPRYVISLHNQELYLDGIRTPRKGRGLGSFVNWE